jgi:hypothetical protein
MTWGTTSLTRGSELQNFENVSLPKSVSDPKLILYALRGSFNVYIRGPSEKFVDWGRCAAVMHREAVNVMPSCSGVNNVVAA